MPTARSTNSSLHSRPKWNGESADDTPQPFQKPAYADPLRTLRVVRTRLARDGPVPRQVVHYTQAVAARINTNARAENVGGGVYAQELQGSLVYRKMHMVEERSWMPNANETFDVDN